MNAMGHAVKNFIGVNKSDIARSISEIVPGYMAMGSAGMADMGSMEMPLPDNTLPMMTGYGQFGPIEMGGMFTVVKVRKGQAKDDYADPGWYQNPEGTVSYEWQGTSLAEPERSAQPKESMLDENRGGILTVRKPGHSMSGHQNH
jgi:hypothetical protein